jgi:hypothetical protein
MLFFQRYLVHRLPFPELVAADSWRSRQIGKFISSRIRSSAAEGNLDRGRSWEGWKMRALVSAAVLALLALNGSESRDDPKGAAGEDLLFPLPAYEVAAGKFEQWQR